MPSRREHIRFTTDLELANANLDFFFSEVGRKMNHHYFYALVPECANVT